MCLPVLMCSFNIQDYVSCIAELLVEVWPPWSKTEVHEGWIWKGAKHKIYLKDRDSEIFHEASWGIHEKGSDTSYKGWKAWFIYKLANLG